MAKRDSATSLVTMPEPDAALAFTPDRAISVTDDADFADIQRLQAAFGVVTFPGANMVPKLHLLGIPFIIVGVRFQKVMRTERGFRDYVTIDAFVSDEATVTDELRKGRIMRSVGREAEAYTSLDDLPVKPTERIMFNDGSTGVRRQIVELLERLGLIRVTERDADEAELKDRRRFDAAWTQWDERALSQVPSQWITADGTEVPEYRSFADGRPFIVQSARGLSGSVYENEFAPSGFATTFYVRA